MIGSDEVHYKKQLNCLGGDNINYCTPFKLLIGLVTWQVLNSQILTRRSSGNYYSPLVL